ncbi:hypothetical protein HZA44_02405 [Candidatus Peregrinibacteria bacterium]|nr:hypothetical protein [Candidatus Peregrinibacteria bacterium]
MDTNDIKSQIERARLFETLPGQKKDETRTIDSMGKGAEKEALARSMAIAPESGKAAEGRIREGVEKGVREKMAGVMGGRESARMEREEARESQKMETVREGMIGASRAAEASKEAEESEMEESEEPSMREQQEQVPNRVDQEGKATQRPRLAQKRAPVEQETTPSSGALKTTLKTLALPLGSGIAAGLMTWWLT